MKHIVTATVRGLSQYYADGLERQEIWADKGSSKPLPYKENQRVPVKLVLGSESYVAGTRTTPNLDIIWICPDLRDHQHRKISLAKVLRANGFSNNEEVRLEVEADVIRVLTQDNSLPSQPHHEPTHRPKTVPGTPAKLLDITTLRGRAGGTELWTSLWIRICQCLDTGIPKWRERIISFGQVAAAESREKGKRLIDSEIFEGVVKAVLSSNTDWAKIERLLPEIRIPFENFVLDHYASLTPADVLTKIYPWLKARGADAQNLKQDLIRLIDTSKQLLIYSKDHNGLHSFIAALLKENSSDPKQLALQFGSQTGRHKLRGMGIALAAEALKNIGFDIAKPDRHVNRAMGCFGLVKFNRWSESYTSREGKNDTVC